MKFTLVCFAQQLEHQRATGPVTRIATHVSNQPNKIVFSALIPGVSWSGWLIVIFAPFAMGLPVGFAPVGPLLLMRTMSQSGASE